MDSDKTIIIDPAEQKSDYGVCPVCQNPLAPDWDNMEFLRCPACRYVKKVATVIAPGNVVGHKYRILSYINGGGAGSIFLCYPLADASVRYVLKVLSHPTPTGRRRFGREAQILSSVTDNPRIARIVDCWEAGEDTFIVMEYVDGQNLKQLVKTCELGEENVLIIAYEVTRALQDIWNDFSIVHRDIKPENIMIDSQSHIKLLDFGLSKQCNADSNTGMITMEKAILGTPGYMSPEHFMNFKNIDFRSDIYSLGATLYYLLTTNEIAPVSKVEEFYDHMVKNSPPPVESFANKCSAECMNMIRRMMAKEPSQRYSSYEELVAELKKLLAR